MCCLHFRKDDVKHMSRHPPIITRLQGGLGNQLYQYAVGRSLALRLQRPLFIDARTILPDMPARHFDLGAFKIEAELVTGLSAFCTRWVGSNRMGRLVNTAFPPARSYRYIRDRQEGFDGAIFSQHDGPIVLHGYWQSYRYFEEIAEWLRRDLTFRRAPSAENSSFIRQIESCASVCVHVRRGDYVTSPVISRSLGTCGIPYYQAAALFLASRVMNPKFFVFSDDPEWAQDNLELPGQMVAIKHNLGTVDVEDLRLMQHCKHFIIANSSFSWWGAWLSVAPGKTVIAPSQWFRQDRSPSEDRIPSSWVRI